MLTRQDFIVNAERYGMYYRHEPGIAARLFSTPGLFQLTKALFRGANASSGGVRQQARGYGGADVKRIVFWSPNYAPEPVGDPPLVAASGRVARDARPLR